MKKLLCILLMVPLFLSVPSLAASAQVLDTEGIDGIVDIEEESAAKDSDDYRMIEIIGGLIIWAGFFVGIFMIIEKIRGARKRSRQTNFLRPMGQTEHLMGSVVTQALFCDACGAKLSKGGAFCEKCGQQIE